MLRRILILDLALVSLLAFAGYRFYRDWRAFGPVHDLAAVQPEPQEFPSLPASVTAAASSEDWSQVYTANPFSFDRNDVAIMVAEPEAPQAGPKPILFGTMLIGSERTAVLAPNGTSNGVARPMRVGEVLDGWKIVAIAPTNVQLESEGVQATVIMNDPTVQAPQNYGRTQAAGSPAVVQAAPANSQPASTLFSPLPAEPAAPSAAPGQQQRPTRVVQTPFGPRTIFTDIP